MKDELTAKENEIIELISQGMNNMEIAEKLVISEKTVKVHMKHILGKLGLRDRSQLIVYYYNNLSPK